MRRPLLRALTAAAGLALLAAPAAALAAGPHFITPGSSYFAFGHSAPIIHRHGYHHRPWRDPDRFVGPQPRRWHPYGYRAPRYFRHHAPYFRHHLQPRFGYRSHAPGFYFRFHDY